MKYDSVGSPVSDGLGGQWMRAKYWRHCDGGAGPCGEPSVFSHKGLLTGIFPEKCVGAVERRWRVGGEFRRTVWELPEIPYGELTSPTGRRQDACAWFQLESSTAQAWRAGFTIPSDIIPSPPGGGTGGSPSGMLGIERFAAVIGRK